MDVSKRLPHALLALRVGVFIVFLGWTLDKLVVPTHAAIIYKKYYFMDNMVSAMFAVGVVEMILILAFLAGYKKNWTYAIVLALHTLSTFAIFGKYFHLGTELVYWASWPMLAACFALYYLRDADTLLVIDKPKSPA